MSARLRWALLLVLLQAAGCASNTPKVAPVTPEGLPVILPGSFVLSPNLYPSELLRKGDEGCVVVSFYLTPDAQVDYFKVLDSQPAGAFDDPAMLVVAKTKFASGQKAGRYAMAVSFSSDPDSTEKIKANCISPPTYDRLN